MHWFVTVCRMPVRQHARSLKGVASTQACASPAERGLSDVPSTVGLAVQCVSIGLANGSNCCYVGVQRVPFCDWASTGTVS